MQRFSYERMYFGCWMEIVPPKVAKLPHPRSAQNRAVFVLRHLLLQRSVTRRRRWVPVARHVFESVATWMIQNSRKDRPCIECIKMRHFLLEAFTQRQPLAIKVCVA